MQRLCGGRRSGGDGQGDEERGGGGGGRPPPRRRTQPRCPGMARPLPTLASVQTLFTCRGDERRKKNVSSGRSVLGRGNDVAWPAAAP